MSGVAKDRKRGNADNSVLPLIFCVYTFSGK